jgi:16S rRNA processing protein RimM
MNASVFEPTSCPQDAVEMGRLMGGWGIKGWVKLVPYSEEPEALVGATSWLLQPPTGTRGQGFDAFRGTVRVKVKDCKPHSDGWVALLDGVNDRTLADALKGASVWMSRADFPQTDGDDEFYWVDLVGLDVINREGVHLGKVDSLISTGPNSVLVVHQPVNASEAKAAKEATEAKDIAKEGVTERLIPFVGVYIDQVDKSAGRILVDWQPDY